MLSKKCDVHLKRLKLIHKLQKGCTCVIALGSGITAVGLICWIYAITRHSSYFGLPVALLIAGLLTISLGSSIGCFTQFTEHKIRERIRQYLLAQLPPTKAPKPSMDNRKLFGDAIKFTMRDDHNAVSHEAV